MGGRKGRAGDGATKLTWFELVQFLLQLGHVVVELAFLQTFQVLFGEDLQIHLRHLRVLDVQLVDFPQGVRGDLGIPSHIVRKFVCLS